MPAQQPRPQLQQHSDQPKQQVTKPAAAAKPTTMQQGKPATSFGSPHHPHHPAMLHSPTGVLSSPTPHSKMIQQTPPPQAVNKQQAPMFRAEVSTNNHSLE